MKHRDPDAASRQPTRTDLENRINRLQHANDKLEAKVRQLEFQLSQARPASWWKSA